MERILDFIFSPIFEAAAAVFCFCMACIRVDTPMCFWWNLLAAVWSSLLVIRWLDKAEDSKQEATY